MADREYAPKTYDEFDRNEARRMRKGESSSSEGEYEQKEVYESKRQQKQKPQAQQQEKQEAPKAPKREKLSNNQEKKNRDTVQEPQKPRDNQSRHQQKQPQDKPQASKLNQARNKEHEKQGDQQKDKDRDANRTQKPQYRQKARKQERPKSTEVKKTAQNPEGLLVKSDYRVKTILPPLEYDNHLRIQKKKGLEAQCTSILEMLEVYPFMVIHAIDRQIAYALELVEELALRNKPMYRINIPGTLVIEEIWKHKKHSQEPAITMKKTLPSLCIELSFDPLESKHIGYQEYVDPKPNQPKRVQNTKKKQPQKKTWVAKEE